ncbi:MAG: hypothetical protein LBV67_04375 [Streptococcaceae bacterium]|jgi:hypothetical protein|nr:hypothetical protein [Streptococcaceae bacterium]
MNKNKGKGHQRQLIKIIAVLSILLTPLFEVSSFIMNVGEQIQHLTTQQVEEFKESVQAATLPAISLPSILAQPTRATLSTNQVTQAIGPTEIGYQSSMKPQVYGVLPGPTLYNGNQYSHYGGTIALYKSVNGATPTKIDQCELTGNGHNDSYLIVYLSSTWNYGDNSSNLMRMLNDVYQDNDPTADYILYYNYTLNVTNPVATSKAILTSTSPIGSNVPMNFASLSGRAKSLTIVGNSTDSLTPTTSNNGNQLLNFKWESQVNSLSFSGGYNANIYFGCPTILRNVNYAPYAVDTAGGLLGIMPSLNVFAQGNPLVIYNSYGWDGNSSNNAISGSNKAYIRIFVGGDGQTTQSFNSTSVWVGSTGMASYSFYGGCGGVNGTITGDTKLTIANTYQNTSQGAQSYGNDYTGIYQVAGGGLAGTVNGNTNLSILGVQEPIATICGGGIGSATGAANVKGNVNTLIDNGNTTGISTKWASPWGSLALNNSNYGNFYGGVLNGTIGGCVTTTFTGNGSWANYNGNAPQTNYTPYSNYIGGSLIGNIGSGSGIAISNNVDTSKFTKAYTNSGGVNYCYFSGGNNDAGSLNNTTDLSKQQTRTSYGLIKGNIVNYIIGGSSADNGAIGGVSGAGGIGTTYLTASTLGINASGSSSAYYVTDADVLAMYKASPATYENNANNATAAATSPVFAVFGDVYTWEKSGVMSVGGADTSYTFKGTTRGAGYYGYVVGNSTVELGTQGTGIGGANFVTSDANASFSNNSVTSSNYSTTTGKAASSSFIVSASGGSSNVNSNTVGGQRQANFWQKGNSSLIVNNALCKFAIAGAFNGFQDGNSTLYMNGGAVDVALGGGLLSSVQYGTTSALMNNGQIDSVITGGNYNSAYVVGDTQTQINAGYINGSVAGTLTLDGSNVNGNYGYTGNSTVSITGGNFTGATGTTVTTAKVCIGGALNGSILGNCTLNVDATNATSSTFVLPASNFWFVGGSCQKVTVQNNTSSTATTVGTMGCLAGQKSTTSKITINYQGNASVDLLHGNNFSGDFYNDYKTMYCSMDTININAPMDTIGQIQATNFNIGTTSGLWYMTSPSISAAPNISAAINVYQAPKGINSISGGGPIATENFINTPLGSNSTSIITTGAQGNVKINSKLANFGDLIVSANSTLDMTNGQLLNGGLSQNTDYTNTSNNGWSYGNLTLNDGSTLSINSTNVNTTVATIGTFTIGKNVTLIAPYWVKPGYFNLGKINFGTNKDGTIIWQAATGSTPPTGAPDGASFTTAGGNGTGPYSGRYWGNNAGYPVLTFHTNESLGSSGANGGHMDNIGLITPSNFSGQDPNANYLMTYLGDYDATKTYNTTNDVFYLFAGETREFKVSGDVNSGSWSYPDVTNVATNVITPDDVKNGTDKAKIQTAISNNQGICYINTNPNTPTTDLKFFYTMKFSYDKAVEGNPFTFTANGNYYASQVSVAQLGTTTPQTNYTINANYSFDASGNVIPGSITGPSGSSITGTNQQFTTCDYFVNGVMPPETTITGTNPTYWITTATTSNVNTIMATNVFLKESEAKVLTAKQLVNLAQVHGSGILPIMNDTTTGAPVISNDAIAKANQGLQGATSLQITVDWVDGNAIGSSYIIVVPDDTQMIDETAVVVAQGATLTLGQAQAITSVSEVNYYTGADVIITNPDNTITHATPTMTNNDPSTGVVHQLQNASGATTIPVDYSYTTTKGSVITTTANLQVTNGGVLTFTQVPQTVCFGTATIQPTTQTIWANYNDKTNTCNNELIVTDDRETLSNWQLNVQQSAPLFEMQPGDLSVQVSNGQSFDSNLYFNQDASHPAPIVSTSQTVVYSNTQPALGAYTISTGQFMAKGSTTASPDPNDGVAWTQANQKGLFLKVPINQQKAGTYIGTLTWTLQQTP